MNITVLSGRITKELELKDLNGQAFTRFTIAVDKDLSKTKKEEFESQNKPTADFINIQAWGKLAETIYNYTGKGLKIIVNGRIQTGSYEKDGQRVYTTEIIASQVEFLEWKNNNSGNSKQSNNNNSNFEYNEEFAAGNDRRIPF